MSVDENGKQFFCISIEIQWEPILILRPISLPALPKAIHIPPVATTQQYDIPRQDNVTVEPPTMEMSKRNKQEKDKSQKKSKAKDSGKNEPHQGDKTTAEKKYEEAKTRRDELQNKPNKSEAEAKELRELKRKIPKLQKEATRKGGSHWQGTGERGNNGRNGNRPTRGG